MEIQFIPIFGHISKEGFLNFFVWWGLYILVCPTVRSGCCSKFKFYSNWSFGPCKSSFVIIAIFQVQVESALTRAGEKAQIILMMMMVAIIMMTWGECSCSGGDLRISCECCCCFCCQANSSGFLFQNQISIWRRWWSQSILLCIWI